MEVSRCLHNIGVNDSDIICSYHVHQLVHFNQEILQSMCYNPKCTSENATAFRCHKASMHQLQNANPDLFIHPNVTFCRECEKKSRQPGLSITLDDEDMEDFNLDEGYHLPYGKDDSVPLSRVTIHH